MRRAIAYSLLSNAFMLVRGQVSGDGLRIFSDSLTSEIYANDNECSSCWGVSMMLDLLRPGSSGNTLSELCDVVGLCGPEDELLWSDIVSRLTSRYDGECLYEVPEGQQCPDVFPTVQVANSVWIDDESELQKNYSEIVGDYVRQTDFDSDQAGKELNDWVNTATNGLIDSIIEEGPIPFDLVALNSIYFKASWQDQFFETDTNEDVFYTSVSGEETASQAHFMHMVELFQYADDQVAGHQVVKLPYSASSLSMVVVLPFEEDLPPVSSDEVIDAVPMLKEERVALALPKFQYASLYEESLKAGLQEIGLVAPFVEGFCGLLEGPCQILDTVIQKTFIEVNEKGTVAAAVTGGMTTDSDSEILANATFLFMADHPFQFFLYDAGEDIVLFEGRVGAPEIPDGSTAQLEASHSDADFWSRFGVESPQQPEPEPSIDVPPEQLPGQGLRNFSDSLTSEIYINDNDCSSSWGVSMMLDLLRPGGSGDTLNQLCDVAYLCGPENELLWTDTVNRMTSLYDGECVSNERWCAKPTLQVANSVWIDTESELQTNYSEIVGDYVMQIDFDSDLAGQTINEWVNSSTNGLIDSIVDEGPVSFGLVALNSIYFKASWKDPFFEVNTNEDTFYKSVSRDETASMAHFMHMVDDFPYSDDQLGGYQVIQLPYSSSNLSMVMALPFDGNELSATSEEVISVVPNLEIKQVALALPKFQFESEYSDDLKAALQTIGLTAPFVQGFCGLLEGLCQVLDLVIQKTFIEVNEKGTVAAAVTGGMTRSRGTVANETFLFLADHPFQFFIYDAGEDLVLFEGSVGAPGIPGGSTAELESSHSDSDFWSRFGVETIQQPEALDPSTSPGPIETTSSPPSTEPSVNSRIPTTSPTSTEPSVNSGIPTSSQTSTEPSVNSGVPTSSPTSAEPSASSGIPTSSPPSASPSANSGTPTDSVRTANSGTPAPPGLDRLIGIVLLAFSLALVASF